jgi:ribosome-associated toxin RatA of RatAB toxin-antitoxin module
MMTRVAERRFSAGVVVRRSCEEAFAWVADHRNAPRALDGVTRWEPLGRRTTGVGARFDVEMSVFGFPLRAVLVLDRWEPPRALGWRSESGAIAQRGRWRFEPREDGCEVTLTIAYEPPGGLAGGLVARQADGIVRHRLRDGMERMRDALEGDSLAR